MLSNDFQMLLGCLFITLLVGLASYGLYCRKKLRSFAGTGRMADIDAWYLKSALAFIATFCLSVVAIINYI